MRAGVVIEKGRLEVIDVPMPEPGPYDALVKITFGATCAGTDIHLMDGQHPNPVAFPTILGHESVGRVISIGEKVRYFKEGDLITRVGCPAVLTAGINSNWGGFAEYGIARDHFAMKEDGVDLALWNKSRVNQVVHPEIDEKVAPMIITWRETLSYVRRLGVGPGNNVLVIGSGANALSLAVHCFNSGADVIAIGSESRRGVFERGGISRYIDYRSDDLKDLVKASSCGQFDYFIDGVGTSGTINILLDQLVKGGCLGVYGWNDRRSYAINPFKATSGFYIYADGYDEEESNEEVQSMILDGKLDATLWYDIDSPVPLEELPEAYDSLRRHEALKYLISI